MKYTGLSRSKAKTLLLGPVLPLLAAGANAVQPDSEPSVVRLDSVSDYAILVDDTRTPPPPKPIVVTARGMLADGTGPQMEIRVDGELIGSVEVRNLDYQDYTFNPKEPVPSGAKVDVVFINDYYSPPEDRNLLVRQVVINGMPIASSFPTVTYDKGSGPRAFDGINTEPGRERMPVNGALRFKAPEPVVVSAKSNLLDNKGAVMQLRINGQLVGSVEVDTNRYLEYKFSLREPLAPYDTVDVVYVNDEDRPPKDRNLWIKYVKISSEDLARPTDPGVNYDRGSGNAAFDGLDVIPGQREMNVNGALRFRAKEGLHKAAAGVHVR